MPVSLHNHLIINGRTQVLPYTSPNLGRSKVIARLIGDRQRHGTSIKQQFDTAVDDFRSDYNDAGSVYVVFKSPIDVLLDIDKLDKGNFRLASYRKIPTNGADGTPHDYYEATVCLNRRAIAQFLSKVEQYLTRTTPLTYNDDGTVKGGGNPFNQTLVANIEEIRAATLQSFWQEPELAFPILDEDIWWEIWLSRDNTDNILNPIGAFLPILKKETGKI